jgi:hypothetical protein
MDADRDAEDTYELTPLAEGAMQLHELYVAYVEAGFEEYVAMWMCVAVANGLPMPEWLAERLQGDE